MAIQFLSSLSVTGSVSVSSVAQDNSSYTGILVWDGSALKYRTKTQVRSDIGAGTGSMSSFSVTNGTTTGSITNGGTITLTAGTGMSIGLSGSGGSGIFTIGANTANASTIGVGNVNINGAGAYDGLRLSYSSGTATLGLDPESLPSYTGTASGADTGSITMIIHNNDNENNVNQLLELGQLQTMINDNHYVTGASFDTSNGILTLSRNGLSSVTVDLDNRYVPLTGGSGSGNAMTGDLHIKTGAPKIYLQDTTDDDDQAIIFRNNGGTDEYKIATADFTGGGGADGFYIGSTTSDGEIGLVTANTTALTLSTSQNATFAGTITLAGALLQNTTGDFVIQNNAGAQLDIKSNRGVRLFIDKNADDTSHKFEILSNVSSYSSGNVVASVDQSGNAIFAGSITIPEYINHTGDGNTTFGFGGADDFRVTVGGTKRLNVTTSGVEIAGNITGATKVVTTEIESSSSLLLDAAADITIDAGGQDIILSDDGTIFGTLSNSSGFQIRSRVNNADMFLRGVDNGTEFNALRLDMSAEGDAYFNKNISLNGKIVFNNNQELRWKDSDGTERTVLELDSSNNLYLGTSAGGNLNLVNGSSYTTALTIDSSQNSTFTGTITASVPSIGTSTYTGIVVSSNGALKYRTKSQIRSDIGAGTGSMSSWNIGDGSTSDSVSNGQTVNIIAGSNMTVEASGDREIEITNTSPDTGLPAIINTSGTPSFSSGITAAEIRSLIGAGTGTGTMSSWTIKEGNGTESTQVTNGETVTIAQGTGIQSEMTSTSSGGTITITNTSPDTGLPAIINNGGEAELSDEMTAAAIRSLIGAGTGSGTMTGLGTANTLAKFTGNTVLGNSEITDTGSIIKLGSNSSGQETLYLDTVNRKVGFRTQTPGSAFDVNGTFRARNELNIGETTEQNFFVEGGSGPRYVKMGAYTPTNKDTWLSGSANTGLVRSTAGFGTGGKVLMATYRYTTKIEQGGWPTASGSANGVNVTPAYSNGRILQVKDIFVHKAGSTKGSGWSTNKYAVEFVQLMANGSYTILGGVSRSTIINGDGVWYYSAYNNLYAFNNPQDEQRGTINAPVKLMLPSAINSTNQPTWYITVEYTLLNQNVWRGNPDQTLT